MKSFKISSFRAFHVGIIIGLIIMNRIAAGNQTYESNSAEGIRITVIYDNYTLTEGCRPEWGFSCIIKGTEKCILFDTGGNGELLLENMDRLGIEAGDVELVVVSHDHWDHTGGLEAFLGRKGNVTAYLPLTVSASLIQMAESRGATVVLPDEPVQICDGVHLVRMRIGTLDEQFMTLETPQGLVVITGCAHPGIVQILQKAKQLFRQDIYFVFGGFHLNSDTDSQVLSKIRQIKSLGVQKVGPSHCTGEVAIELFRQEFGNDFVPLGIGPVTIPNRCDFNGDGKINIDDLVMFIEHWHTNEPLYDIAPGLFGDGTVDIKDLETFMQFYEQ